MYLPVSSSIVDLARRTPSAISILKVWPLSPLSPRFCKEVNVRLWLCHHHPLLARLQSQHVFPPTSREWNGWFFCHLQLVPTRQKSNVESSGACKLAIVFDTKFKPHRIHQIAGVSASEYAPVSPNSLVPRAQLCLAVVFMSTSCVYMPLGSVKIALVPFACKRGVADVCFPARVFDGSSLSVCRSPRAEGFS